MSIFGRLRSFSSPRLGKQILVSLVSLGLIFATWPQNLPAYQATQAPAQPAQGPAYAQQTSQQLQ